MALNITLAGSIRDSGDNLINAKLQIFVYNNKNGLTKWSDVFLTEDTDYNKNLGDPDISGQENTLGLADANKEFVIISVWKDGSREDLTNVPTEYAYIIQELNGSELYIQDIKLGVNPAILCANWTVPNSIIQGANIIGVNNNTNEITYEAYSETHYLFKKYSYNNFNEIIFPFLGPKTVQYNFNSEGFSDSNVYTPGVGGDTNVKIKVTDYFDNEATCEKIVKVYYSVQPGFLDLDGSYVTNEDIIINTNPSGHVDKIISTSYLFYSETINLPNFTRKLTQFGSIPITQYIVYFNAYENITIELHRDISMQNIPPELNLVPVKEPLNDMAAREYTFAHNGTDIDGTIEKVEWQIYRNNPDINGNENWNLYYTTTPITDLSDWNYNIDGIIGDLRVRAIVYDNLGATAFQEYDIANDCSDIAISFDNIDWTKKIQTIDFSVTTTKKLWETKTQKIVWDMKPVRVLWENKPKKVIFNLNTNKIDWKYKIYFDI